LIPATHHRFVASFAPLRLRRPFLAHLSAAATIACLPVLLDGWAAQDKLVRGLSMGAVK
jgi:ABC-type glycerol-3-phosphate transport system permease component